MILAKGAEHCIVTLGERGSIWASQKGDFRFTVPTLTAVDTTAAGDVFNGYLAEGITRALPIRESIVIGHAAASLSVLKKGAQTSIPNREETQLFLEKYPINFINVS
tara:strand:- start:287 stop:607 length:321 start_codon:yes stop_codon:yes gene_type:complete